MPRKKAQETSITIKKADVFEGKRFIREYSLEVHGESFQVLAKQFADKHNYEVVYGE